MGAQWVMHSALYNIQCVYGGKLSLILIPTQISFFKLQIEIEFSKLLQCSSSLSLSTSVPSSLISVIIITIIDTIIDTKGQEGVEVGVWFIALVISF